jgi:DNA repair exonuclease SbcCD ATPase subunit
VHILSKIFVVVAAVLSVLLSGLTMAYAVNADRVLADYSAEQARRQSAEGNLRAETEGASVERSRLNASISDLNNALAARDSQIRELQTGVAREIAAKRDAQSQRDEILNKTKVLEETSRTQAKLLEGYRTEVTSLRDSEVVFRQRELELEDRINDLESQREVLEQTMRALQEQLTEVRTTLAGAQTGSTSSAGAAARPFVDSGTLITARIEKIEKDPASGALYATINAGTNDRIRDNMQLYIGRNNEFIGHLIITKTDLNHAIGRIDLLGRSVAVQSGDTVLSRLR